MFTPARTSSSNVVKLSRESLPRSCLIKVATLSEAGRGMDEHVDMVPGTDRPFLYLVSLGIKVEYWDLGWQGWYSGTQSTSIAERTDGLAVASSVIEGNGSKYSRVCHGNDHSLQKTPVKLSFLP